MTETPGVTVFCCFPGLRISPGYGAFGLSTLPCSRSSFLGVFVPHCGTWPLKMQVRRGGREKRKREKSPPAVPSSQICTFLFLIQSQSS